PDGAARRSRSRDARVRRADHARRDARHRRTPRPAARGRVRRSRHFADHADCRLVQLHQSRGRRARRRHDAHALPMTSSRSPARLIAVALALLVVIAAAVYFVRRQTAGLPAPGSAAYEETARLFYRGLAALQVGLIDDSKREFAAAAAASPGEPAAYAN